MDTEPSFLKILGTYSLTDIAIIKSVLDAEGVRYYFQGENWLSLCPVDPTLLLVAEEDIERAIELLRPLKLNYINNISGKRSDEE